MVQRHTPTLWPNATAVACRSVRKYSMIQQVETHQSGVEVERNVLPDTGHGFTGRPVRKLQTLVAFVSTV